MSRERSLVLVQWVGPGNRSTPERGDPVPVRVARAFAKRLRGLWLVTHGTSAEAACARIEALCRKENPKAFVGVVSLRSLEDGDDTRAAREALSSGADKIVYRSSMAREATASDDTDAAQVIVRESLHGRDATDETELAVSCATGTSSMIAAMLAELADAAVDAVDERRARALTVSLARWDTMAQNRGLPTLQTIEQIDATRELIGRSTRARARAMRWAPVGVPVLLLGETGAGKTTIADELNALWWPKSTRAPIRVNCALLEPSLAASELFGAKKGAFTGATATLPGVFGKAQSERESTLFLDEFAELPAGTQAKLLTAIEPSAGREGGRRYRFTPVGDTVEKSIPVEQLRVVLATNRTIDGANGALREDLAARVSQVVLRVAPLRDTPAALPALVLAALEEFSRAQAPDASPAPAHRTRRRLQSGYHPP
jgi:transcriptional regulator with GAF, ATPase, and Fis domain